MADPRTPRAAKWLIGGGVGYAMLPFDLLPDFIPIVGQLDDILIAPALIGLGMRLVPAQVKADDRSRTRRLYSLSNYESAEPLRCEALPAPFGVRVCTNACTVETFGPIGFLSLELMYEYRLVVIDGPIIGLDRFAEPGMRTASNVGLGLCDLQTRLDVSFRSLPLIAAVAYCRAGCDSPVRFVDTEAIYAELPPELKHRIEGLRLRCLLHSDLPLDAVLDQDGRSACPRDNAHVVTGAQFLNLLMDGNCRIVGLSEKSANQLLADLRKYALKDKFCYTYSPSTGELIAWDPRRILRISSDAPSDMPRFVYPEGVSRTVLFH